MIEIKHQYSHNKKIIGDYVISYGLMQSIHSSCDTIDFFKVNEHKYGFYLADVSGSGVESVKTMHSLQDLINKYCHPVDDTSKYQKNLKTLVPNQVAKKINQEMHRLKSKEYVTLTYGILDLVSNAFEYTVAGYYPNPILINDKFEAKYLYARGYPLGLIKDANFEKFNVLIEEGSSLIFFSDGILRFLMLAENGSHDPNGLNQENTNKENKLLKLISEDNSKIEVEKILHKLNLNYSTPIVDDIVILIIQRNSAKAG